MHTDSSDPLEKKNASERLAEFHKIRMGIF